METQKHELLTQRESLVEHLGTIARQLVEVEQEYHQTILEIIATDERIRNEQTLQ